MTKNQFFSLLICLFFATLLSAQESTADDKSGPSAGLDLLGGAMFLPEKAGVAGIYGVSVWTTVNCKRNNPNRPKWCIILDLPVWRRVPIKDPWKRMPPIIFIPPFPPPPNPDPWTDFPLNELELGRTLIVSPSIGLQFGGVDSKLSFKVFGGGGFQHTEASSSVIRDLTYRTTDMTAPVLTYGAAAQLAISNNASVKLEFRTITSFEGNMSVVGPDGSIAIFEGMSMNAPMISAGVGIGLR